MVPGLFMAVVSSFLLRPGRLVQASPEDSKAPAASRRVEKDSAAVAGKDSLKAGQKPLRVGFVMAPDYRWDVKREIERQESLPFQLLGLGSGAARVVDSFGKELIGSTAVQEVFALDVGPNGSRFVVSLGGGKGQLYDSKTGKVIQLPASPGDPRMFGFGDWKWISDDVILSTFGLQALDAQGKPVTSCLGNNVAATQLYAFRVSTGVLAAVNKPAFIAATVFSVNRVSHDGYVEFTADGNQLSPGRKVAWARVTEN